MILKYGYKDVFIDNVTLENYKDLFDSIELLYLNKSKDSFFYQIKISKLNLKTILQSASVPTSNFIQIDKKDPAKSLDQAGKFLTYPMIIKPSISYASLHISNKSVVINREEALIHIEALLKTINEEFFLEKYLSEHEYTVLIAGDKSNGLEIFPVLERIFHSNLKSTEKLLTFENSWADYRFNGYTIPEDNSYHSIPVISQEQIQRIASSHPIPRC